VRRQKLGKRGMLRGWRLEVGGRKKDEGRRQKLGKRNWGSARHKDRRIKGQETEGGKEEGKSRRLEDEEPEIRSRSEVGSRKSESRGHRAKSIARMSQEPYAH
jgi:hypothetical protein